MQKSILCYMIKLYTVAVVIVLIVILVVMACTNPDPPHNTVPSHTSMQSFPTNAMEGVVLHGCRGKNDNWIENTNTYLVRIRYVEVYHDKGEITRWMFSVGAGGKLPLGSLNNIYVERAGFFIYSWEGGLLGFLPGDCLQE